MKCFFILLVHVSSLGQPYVNNSKYPPTLEKYDIKHDPRLVRSASCEIKIVC